MKNKKIKGDIYEMRGFSPGFTFIEIIVVLLILGILGAVALEHSFNYEADLAGAVEVVKDHLRYAQIKAINSDVKWGLKFSHNSYVLWDKKNNVTANLPGDLPPQSITYSLLPSINPVMFDQDGSLDQDGSPDAPSITITLTKGGSRTITVVKNTGFIQ